MKTYKVHKNDNNIYVTCNKCDTVHQFTFYTFNQYFLENKEFVSVLDPDETDKFVLDGSILHPIWVCRNFKCRNESMIMVKNENEED